MCLILVKPIDTLTWVMKKRRYRHFVPREQGPGTCSGTRCKTSPEVFVFHPQKRHRFGGLRLYNEPGIFDCHWLTGKMAFMLWTGQRWEETTGGPTPRFKLALPFFQTGAIMQILTVRRVNWTKLAQLCCGSEPKRCLSCLRLMYSALATTLSTVYRPSYRLCILFNVWYFNWQLWTKCNHEIWLIVY